MNQPNPYQPLYIDTKDGDKRPHFINFIERSSTNSDYELLMKRNLMSYFEPDQGSGTMTVRKIASGIQGSLVHVGHLTPDSPYAFGYILYSDIDAGVYFDTGEPLGSLTNSDRSPTTSLSKSSSKLEYIQELLNDFICHAEINYSVLISKRIEHLYKIRDSEDAGSFRIGSLKYFLKFINSHINLTQPSIVLTINGNIKSRWELNDNNLVAIEFTPNGIAKHTVFTMNEIHNDIVDRLSGITTVDNVYDYIKSLGVAHWEN